MNPYYKFMDLYIDHLVNFGLVMYFWPIYQIGMQDEWAKLGITLNGAKPICQSPSA